MASSFDPHALAAEVEKLQGQGVAISRENLRVAENVPLILSVHRELDALREAANSGTKIGTTKRGIGPAYEDKVGRRAIRLMDLADLDSLPRKDRAAANRITTRSGAASSSKNFRPRPFLRNLPRLRPRCCPIWISCGG